jgi:hypothetical protein
MYNVPVDPDTASMDLTPHRQQVARALNLLEAAIQRLVDALAHRAGWVSTEDTHNERDAIREICAAYSTIDYGMEDEIGSSIVCMGVAGVSADVFEARQSGQHR